MNTENGRFLEEGIKRYGEARDTVIAFEQEMGKIVEQAAKNRKDWHPLKGVKIGRAIANRSNEFGYWIAVAITGKSSRGEKAVIDCGLWWKWADVSYPFIYANYYKQPKRVAAFTWKKKGSNIQSFSKWQRTFLYLPLRKAADIEEGLNSLLRALLKQLE
jgi:hypothetical protein